MIINATFDADTSTFSTALSGDANTFPASFGESLQVNPPPGGSMQIDNRTLIQVDGVVRVNTAEKVEQDNTLPITSAAVHATVGNIEVLLGTI